MSEEDRPILTPNACFSHDQEDYHIEIELPGVDKDHIELTVSEQGICVAGSKENVELLGCWYLGHKVDEDKTKAKYQNGMLFVGMNLTNQNQLARTSTNSYWIFGNEPHTPPTRDCRVRPHPRAGGKLPSYVRGDSPPDAYLASGCG